jgi:hypothetical protein
MNVPFAMTRAGKQNMVLDATINMPQPEAGGKLDQGIIDVRRFDQSSDYYTSSMPTRMDFGQAGGKRTLNMKADWKLEAKPEGAKEFANFLDTMRAATPYASDDAKYAELKGKMLAAAPNLTGVGPITLAFDLDAAIAEPGAATGNDQIGGDAVNIRRAELSHGRWGVDVKGNISQAKDGHSVSLDVGCRKCKNLTSDVYTTALQAQDVYTMMNPGKPGWGVNETMHTGIDQLFAQVGKASGEDIIFALRSPKPGDLTINDKPFQEVMLMAMPLMAPAAPAAPMPTEGSLAPGAGAAVPAPQAPDAAPVVAQ